MMPGQVSGFDEVLEHVLAVRRPVAQPAEQRHDLGVHRGDADLDQRVFAGPRAQLLDLRHAALVDLLDAVRVDPAVENELLEGDPRNFAAYRIEAGEQHRLGGVVDDQVDAGHRLEGPDVAALATDDAALHVVARQVQHRHDRLGGLLAGHPLDREGDDVASPLLALVGRGSFDVADDDRGLALCLVLHRGDQLSLGRLGGQTRRALQDQPPLLGHVLECLAALRGLGIELGQLTLACLDLALLGVDPRLALGQPVFAALEVGPKLAQLGLEQLHLGVLGLSSGVDQIGLLLRPAPHLDGVGLSLCA